MTTQTTTNQITNQISDLSTSELKRVRNFVDNRLHENDPDYANGKPDLDSMDKGELGKLRDDINQLLTDEADSTLSSADASADDEKRKYIAQNGSNPLAQETAQSVPAAVSDEVKDLQNEAARIEHDAKSDEGVSDEDKAERIKSAVDRA